MTATPGSLDTRMAASIHRAATAWTEPGLGFPQPPEWVERSSCAAFPDDTFFPPPSDPEPAALAICAVCDVRTDCLEYALANQERYGIWGGLTETQRADLFRVTPKPSGPRPIPHGTESGYREHYRRNEKPCEECRAGRSKRATA